MQLPGGLLGPNGVVDRFYAWTAFDGAVELAFADAARERCRPEAVSRMLAAALGAVGGESATRERVDALSVPDRRYLMIELAGLLGLSGGWVSHPCGACEAPFDFALDLRDLPVETAGSSYPHVVVETSAGALTLRVPNGADQLRLAAANDTGDAVDCIMARCLEPSGGAAVPALLSDADRAAIDEALEAASPKIPWATLAHCPECNFANVIPIDVAAWLPRVANGIFDDVHRIAAAYGWSERDILALPRERRQIYLGLIEGDPRAFAS